MLPLATTLRDRGHEVLFATAEDAREPVEAAGLTMAPAGWALAPRMAALTARHPEILETPPSERPVLMFRVLFGDVSAPPMFDALLPLATDWRPDVVLHDPAELAAPIVAAALGVPSAVHSWGRAIPGSILASADVFTEPMWARVGLAPRPLGGAYDRLYVDLCPPSMRLTADVEYLGRTRAQALRPESVAAGADELPPELAAALAGGRPLVYATFGTVFNVNPTFASVVAALAGRDDVVAVVTVGHNGDPAAFGDVPAHVHVERYVSQAALLPRCAVVASHAGSGTMLGALALGIPHLLLPQAADQFRNTEACLAAGAGLALSGDDVTPAAIDAALTALLTDSSYRDAARRVQAEIAAMPDVDEVAAVIETL
jgi:UDP:flavonoid glycosyltransferase YjiC (YdhE family)